MDALAKRRRIQIGSIIGLVAVLILAIAYNAWRPAETDADRVRALGTMIIDTRMDHATAQQREEFREQWESLSPQARQEVFNMVARHRIQEMRQQFHQLDANERPRKIRETLDRMRERRQAMPQAEREEVRARLNTEEGRMMVKTAMNLYLSEFTARERAEMDPLMHEWLFQIQELAR